MPPLTKSVTVHNFSRPIAPSSYPRPSTADATCRPRTPHNQDSSSIFNRPVTPLSSRDNPNRSRPSPESIWESESDSDSDIEDTATTSTMYLASLADAIRPGTAFPTAEGFTDNTSAVTLIAVEGPGMKFNFAGMGKRAYGGADTVLGFSASHPRDQWRFCGCY